MENDLNQDLSKKREDALNHLRENRVETRRVDLSQKHSELEQARSILKKFAQQEKLKQSTGIVDDKLEDEIGEEIEDEAEASEANADSSVSSMIRQLRRSVKAKQALKNQAEEQSDPELALSFSPEMHHQLIKSLLSADFLENTRLWLSSVSDIERELPSTSLEDLEAHQKQVRYRFKVLKVMLEETQRELDYLESQIRVIKSVAQNANDSD